MINKVNYHKYDINIVVFIIVIMQIAAVKCHTSYYRYRILDRNTGVLKINAFFFHMHLKHTNSLQHSQY